MENIGTSSWWREKKLSMLASFSILYYSLPLSPPLLRNKLIGCVLSGTVPFLQTGSFTNKTQCPWPVIPPVHTFTRTHRRTGCISMQQASRLWVCQSNLLLHTNTDAYPGAHVAEQWCLSNPVIFHLLQGMARWDKSHVHTHIDTHSCLPQTRRTFYWYRFPVFFHINIC